MSMKKIFTLAMAFLAVACGVNAQTNEGAFASMEIHRFKQKLMPLLSLVVPVQRQIPI